MLANAGNMLHVSKALVLGMLTRHVLRSPGRHRGSEARPAGSPAAQADSAGATAPAWHPAGPPG